MQTLHPEIRCSCLARLSAIAVAILAFVPLVTRAALGDDAQIAVRRATDFLATEVPRWHRENHCYSCHNNGDAARALMSASRAGLLSEQASLADTLAFLQEPNRWDSNGPDGPFKDQKLARIQFAAAAAEAQQAGMLGDRASLNSAAKLLAELQLTDGSWPADAPGTLGSPVTYGQPLATWMALRTLEVAGATEHGKSIARARQWFLAREPQNTLDAAAGLLALAGVDSARADQRRNQSLELLQAGQSDDGGWGPFVNSRSEVFDTAIAMLALAAQPDSTEQATMLAQGRKYLVARQANDGSWPPTTRPPGADSYAQRLSTSGWALMALLATAPEGTQNPSD